MIHYHGSPISGTKDEAARFLNGRHSFVSYAHPNQLDLAMECCQSFALDNGAFSAWQKGVAFDFSGYSKWVDDIKHHPAFDFAVIPDIIDGSEKENDKLLKEWNIKKALSAPVWHMHESFERLKRLASEYTRICIGSSGEFSEVGSGLWLNRINMAFRQICNDKKQIITKVHGLRMLNPGVFTKFPFASADSTNVGQNVGSSARWEGNYAPVSARVKAAVLADRIESFQSCAVLMPRPFQDDFFQSSFI